MVPPARPASAAPPSDDALPPSKPMAACQRVSLYQREVTVSPSAAAIEILFALAKELTEGQTDDRGYLGSTMLTVDLSRAADLVSDACDAANVRRLADLAAFDERIKQRARAVALGAAHRVAGAHLVRPELDVRVRALGEKLHIDVDVEGTLPGGRRAGAAR